MTYLDMWRSGTFPEKQQVHSKSKIVVLTNNFVTVVV